MAAKTIPDMIIQLNISAPSLEVAIKALTQAIVQMRPDKSEIVVPAGSALQIAGVDVTNAPQNQPNVAPQETATQPQAASAPAMPTQVAPVVQPQFSDRFMNIPDEPAPAIPTQAAPAAQPQVAPAPVPAAPQAAPMAQPQITLDTICNAGAKLVERGQMNQVIGLLGKYGVQAVNQIRPEQFVAFAADLRALGAQI